MGREKEKTPFGHPTLWAYHLFWVWAPTPLWAPIPLGPLPSGAHRWRSPSDHHPSGPRPTPRNATRPHNTPTQHTHTTHTTHTHSKKIGVSRTWPKQDLAQVEKGRWPEWNTPNPHHLTRVVIYGRAVFIADCLRLGPARPWLLHEDGCTRLCRTGHEPRTW